MVSVLYLSSVLWFVNPLLMPQSPGKITRWQAQVCFWGGLFIARKSKTSAAAQASAYCQTWAEIQLEGWDRCKQTQGQVIITPAVWKPCSKRLLCFSSRASLLSSSLSFLTFKHLPVTHCHFCLFCDQRWGEAARQNNNLPTDSRPSQAAASLPGLLLFEMSSAEIRPIPHVWICQFKSKNSSW